MIFKTEYIKQRRHQYLRKEKVSGTNIYKENKSFSRVKIRIWWILFIPVFYKQDIVNFEV